MTGSESRSTALPSQRRSQARSRRSNRRPYRRRSHPDAAAEPSADAATEPSPDVTADALADASADPAADLEEGMVSSGFVFHRSPYEAKFRRSFMSVAWREGVAVLELRPDRTAPVTATLPLHPDSTVSSLGEEEVLPARGGGSSNGGLTLTTLQLRWPAAAVSGRGGRLGGGGKVDAGSELAELPLPASRTRSRRSRSRSRSRSRVRTLARAAGQRR